MRYLSSFIIIFYLITGYAIPLQAQSKMEVYIDQELDVKTFAKVTDSTQLSAGITEWVNKQRVAGFLLAGLDSIAVSHNITKVYLTKSRQFYYLVLESDSSSISELQSLHLNISDNAKHNAAYWSNIFNEWIDYAAAHGYPFARVDLNTTLVKSDTLVAKYKFSKGRKIYFHQTDQRHKKILKDDVLNRMINIIPGELYNQRLLEDISQQINSLRYIQMKSSPRILFTGDEATVWLYLEKSNASKFDILLGLNPENTVDGKKYVLTGEAGFEVFNALKYGERLFLKYENLVKNSPRLRLGFDFPYLSFMPFGLSSDFHLFRFGEEYIDLSSQFVVTYPWSLFQHSGISFNYLNSTVLNPDSISLSRTHRLPAQLDYSFISVGLQHYFNNLDYQISPTSGWQISLDLKAGKKKFNANSILLSYESDLIHVQLQYDSLNQDQEQAVYQLNLSRYLPLHQRHVIKLSAFANGILSSGTILNNELLRIGGYNSLRGFDEDFFKCTHATILTTEYRFLIDRNSFINVFNDFALLQQGNPDSYTWNGYDGFGLGIQFQTRIGAFSLQYAIGFGKDKSVELGNGKIHFGYSTLF